MDEGTGRSFHRIGTRALRFDLPSLVLSVRLLSINKGRIEAAESEISAELGGRLYLN